jgi:RNA polymerase sigma-70 factor (ECF subfamily)
VKSLRDLLPPGLGLGVQNGAASVSDSAQSSVQPDATRLVAEHFDFIWRLVRRFGLSPEDADDVAQQVFMTATQKLEDIRPGSERTYLYGVALRVTSNLRRKVHRHREEGTAPLEDFRCPALPPDEAAALSAARTLLDEILRTLPANLARVFVLASVEQLELSEIAALEQIPQGTAASRLRRARAAFAERLAKRQYRSPFQRN